MKKALTLLIILLIIAGAAIGATAYFTDGFQFSISDVFNSNNVDFYICVDEQEYRTGDGIEIGASSDARIEVKNGGAYTVKVQPIAASNFDFLLDDKLAGFTPADVDYTVAFDVQRFDDYFTLNATLRPMQQILEQVYAGHAVTDVPMLPLGSYFELIITSSAGEKIVIELVNIGANNIISLDKTEIVF